MPKHVEEKNLFVKKLLSNGVFVSNLKADATEEAVNEHFAQFGEVELVQLNKKKCQAFVTFADEKSVETTLEKRKHKVSSLTFINNEDLYFHCEFIY